MFEGLNLTIKSNETTGIVGATGSGKTTLIRLLLRFAEPKQGSIEWAGKPLPEWNLSTLRSSMSLVDQHITLFPTSILENIRYGNPEASDEEVKAAALVAEASNFIEELPDSWGTLVGEGATDCLEGRGRELRLHGLFSRMLLC